MSREEFLDQQQKAMEEIKKMNMKAQNGNSAMPKAFLKETPKSQNSHPQPSLLGGLGINFTNLLKEKDTALILGLLLILYSENADKRLLFALIYILL